MIRFLAVLFVVLVLAGCTSTDTPDPSASTPAPSFTDTLPNTTVITTTTFEPVGAIAIDGLGHPLYVYLPDENKEVSTCTALCPNVYAPVLVDDTLVAKGGMDENLLGVGGDGQVLYNGHLLYIFTGDSGDGSPKGITNDFLLITPGGSVKGTVS